MFDQRATYIGQPPSGALDDGVMLSAARERAAYLGQADRDISGSLNPDRAVRRALNAVVPALVDWAQLMVPDRTGLVYAAVRADRTGRPLTAQGPPAGARTGQGRILATGRAELMHVPDGDAIPDAVNAMVPAPELRQDVLALRPADLLAIPLSARGSTFGTLTLARRAGRGFEPEDVTLAVELAARIALAIDTARLYEEQARVSEVLAASLRARELPDTPGLAISARMRAALSAADIGGDFYDVLGVPGDWSVLLGDVIGKGAEAAILTGQARHTIRGAAFYDRRPAELLRVLNSALHGEAARSGGPGKPLLLTAVTARVHPLDDGGAEITLASAGHPYPLVIRATGEVTSVEVGGLLAGVVAAAKYQEVQVRLGPGDMLLLYTDGVIEAAGRTDRFGLDRLVALARAYAGSGPHALVEAVDIAVSDFNAGFVSDDVAILALAGTPS